jgi:hypothetical protein
VTSPTITGTVILPEGDDVTAGRFTVTGEPAGVGVFVGVLVGVDVAVLVGVPPAVIVKFVLEMSKKILLTASTLIRAVAVGVFGTVVV